MRLAESFSLFWAASTSPSISSIWASRSLMAWFFAAIWLFASRISAFASFLASCRTSGTKRNTVMATPIAIPITMFKIVLAAKCSLW